MKYVLVQSVLSCPEDNRYSSSPSTSEIICGGVVVVFSSPKRRVKFERRQIIVPRKVLLMLETEAAFGRCMLRIVNAGEGTDSSHHQFCSTARTAQNIFYHHPLSFFFISFKKEFKMVQCSCLPIFQPVAVLCLVVTLWDDGAPFVLCRRTLLIQAFSRTSQRINFLAYAFTPSTELHTYPLAARKLSFPIWVLFSFCFP